MAVLKEGRIAVARDDHRRQFGLPSAIDAVARANELMCGRVAKEVSTSAAADLTIDLEGGYRFEVFKDSSGYEAWLLATPDGHELVGIGGGGVVERDTISARINPVGSGASRHRSFARDAFALREAQPIRARPVLQSWHGRR